MSQTVFQTQVDIHQEYKRKQRLQIGIVVFILLPLVLLGLLSKYDHLLPRSMQARLEIFFQDVEPFAIPVIIIWGLTAGLVTYFNWRCPQCDKYLGRSIHFKFCPHCGAGFEKVDKRPIIL